MHPTLALLVVVLGGYLLGSVSFAVLVSRLLGLADPRSYGSGNPGATNVLRTGRKVPAALTLLGDAGKGCVAVFIAQRHALGENAELTVAAVAVAVTLGHMYSVFLRFRGGKGVSTALGVVLALDLYIAAGAVVTWAIIAFFFRISSLAALVAAVFVPLFSFLLYEMNRFALEPAIALTIISLLLVWRHESNIRKLLAGTESRIGGQDSGFGIQDSGKSQD
jgi:acyl phosphate:glycerol-3-phosphate acyltransferase